MSSEKLLAMITAKTMSMEQGGFGGLNGRDIALALGGLPPGPTNLILSLYCDDSIARKELYYRLFTEASGMVKPITGKPYIRTLCEICLAEMAGGRCKACNGRGFDYSEVKRPEDAKLTNEDGFLVTPCDKCNETGSINMTGHEIASILSEVLDRPIDARKYLHSYSHDHAAVLGILHDWLSQAEAHITRRLDDKEDL